MTDKPRLTISDLRREYRLTGRRLLVVEGDSDRRFMQEWLEGEAFPAKISVTPIDRISVSNEDLARHGVSGGNRGRVVCLAIMAPAEQDYLRCLADKDADTDVELTQAPALLWTDYPAIESYALTPESFQFLNRMLLKESLPPANQVFGRILPVLFSFYHVRRTHKNLHRPNYGAGIPANGSFGEFDVWRTVNVPPFELPTIEENDIGIARIREFSYGHDIAPVIIAAFRDALEKGAKVRGSSDLEGRLLAALAASKVVGRERLFQKLTRWAQS